MLKKWTIFEKVWLLVFLVVILAVTYVFSMQGTNWSDKNSIFLNWVVSPVSAITGIICVVLAARGNIWTYPVGLINSLAYGYLAWKVGYYGDWLLNWFYFVPFQFIGYFSWKGHLEEKVFVKKRVLTSRQRVWWIVGTIIATFVIGYLLQNVDLWFIKAMKRNETIYTYLSAVFGIALVGPIMDALTEVFQIVAQILMVARYAEQWVLWFLTNVITIIMWAAVLYMDPSSVSYVLPTLIMWIAYLINSVYGWYKWNNANSSPTIETETSLSR